MKYLIEIEVLDFCDVYLLVQSQKEMSNHLRKIRGSHKNPRRLLQLFNDDFEVFLAFIYASHRLCGALNSIASIDLAAHSKKPEGHSTDSQTAKEVEEIRLREIAELRKRLDAMESEDRRWYCGHCACRSCSEARRKANER